MQDERGLYYHAKAGNPKVRVYVRRGQDGEVEFRLWEMEHPEVWEKHLWLPMSVIKEAASLYREERNPEANPLLLYDLAVAESLLKENKA